MREPGVGKSRRGAWQTLEVRTARRVELVDITEQVERLVIEAQVEVGVCHLFVPHTTAGILVNENADPDVARDIEAVLERLAPRQAGYRHTEGNADAHVKSALVGVSQVLPVVDGRLRLGRWQGVFFCEFDGPRRREVWVNIAVDSDHAGPLRA